MKSVWYKTFKNNNDFYLFISISFGIIIHMILKKKYTIIWNMFESQGALKVFFFVYLFCLSLIKS